MFEVSSLVLFLLMLMSSFNSVIIVLRESNKSEIIDLNGEI